MPTSSSVALAASAARSVSGNGSTFDLGIKTTVELLLNVTAASGTLPTLDVKLYTSRDGATGWAEVVPTTDAGVAGRFAQVAAVGSERITFPGCDRFVRAQWTIGGTGGPSFTFSVAGTAFLVYCTPTNITRLGIPSLSLTKVGSEWLDAEARAQTDVINSYVGVQYSLPPTSFDDSIRRACAVMTACDAMITRGLEPDDQEKLLFDRCREVMAWLEKVAKGEVVLPGFDDATPDEEEGGTVAVSDAPRGW